MLPSSFFLKVETIKEKVALTKTLQVVDSSSSDLEIDQPLILNFIAPINKINKDEKQKTVMQIEKVKQLLKQGAEKHQVELSKRVQSLRHTKPDFGYPDQIEFNDQNASQKDRGWGFFLDMISKFRQREKISTTINYFYDEKLKWKENEIQKMINAKPVSTTANNQKHKAVHFHSIVLKNTPHQNWLLWHY